MATVINFLGGPGVGKSTYAAHTFVQLKVRGLNVGLIQEYAQELILDKRKHILNESQIEVFAEQCRRVKAWVNNYDYVVTDSPLLLSALYSTTENCPCDRELFVNMVLSTFNSYNNVNFLLTRNNNWSFYENERLQTLEEARVIDTELRTLLDTHNVKYSLLENDISLMPIEGVLTAIQE